MITIDWNKLNVKLHSVTSGAGTDSPNMTADKCLAEVKSEFKRVSKGIDKNAVGEWYCEERYIDRPSELREGFYLTHNDIIDILHEFSKDIVKELGEDD
jgi:hypothetical protein